MLKRFLLAAALSAALPCAAMAQVVISVPNAASTGTTLNGLAKLTGAPSTAVGSATTDVGGSMGIVISGAGTTGNALIAVSGQASCNFDGSTTAGDYVTISSTTATDCKDAGTSKPTTSQAIGRVLSTNAGAGLYPIIAFSPANDLAALFATANNWGAGNGVTPVALTAATSTAVNAALSNNFTITLTANTQGLANPTGVLAGQVLRFSIANAGFTGFTVGTNFKFPGGTTPTWSTTSGQTDELTCASDTSGTAVLHCTALLND